MAKHFAKNDWKGIAAEHLINLCASRMECKLTLAGEKTPSIDGYLQVYDRQLDVNHLLQVQIKYGRRYIKRLKKRRPVVRNLDREDILDWHSSGVPTIVVWVDNPTDPRHVLWGNAQLARPGSGELKLRRGSAFDSAAVPRLLNIARLHAGKPNITRLSIKPLLPASVGEAKKAAWPVFREWCRDGSLSPRFGRVEVTRRCWRHVTRVTCSPAAVVHKLSLLPSAREVVERGSRSHHLRDLSADGSKQLHAVRGIVHTPYRANILVEVVLEVTMRRGQVDATKLFALHERRYWYKP